MSKRLAWILTVLFVGLPTVVFAAGRPEEVEVVIHRMSEWIELARPTDPCPGRVTAMSALHLCRAVDPETGEPYNEGGCDPTKLRRAFRLEKAEYLLGEPILVELRIGLDGPGEWDEPTGGNYRARGRDDNFLFVMRRDDGTWVRDPYAPIWMYMGGFCGGYTVTQSKPGSQWLAVQEWCAIDRPGRYDLFCFHCAHDWRTIGWHTAMWAALPDEVREGHVLNADGDLVDAATGKASDRYTLERRWVSIDKGRDGVRRRTPLYDDLPEAALEQIPELWGAEETADFAHFQITIREGTDAERRAMIEYWAKEASGPTDDALDWPERTAAAWNAIVSAQQDDFLPLLAEWIDADPDRTWGIADGLAMRPSAASTALLLTCDPNRAIGGLYYLRDDKLADVIPHVIEWLTHDEPEVRRLSEHYLRKWTGQSFGHTWDDSDPAHPTLEESKAMQPAWREWWTEHEEGFSPVPRRH